MHCDQVFVSGQKKLKVKLEFIVENNSHLSGKLIFLVENLIFHLRFFFFNECFLPSASSSKVVESHGLEYPDGKADTQFHFIPM